jgi:hypothetical protein
VEPTSAPDKYRVSGIVHKLDDTTLQVTELPIRTWTQTYKEMLETMMESTEKAPALIKVRATSAGCACVGLLPLSWPWSGWPSCRTLKSTTPTRRCTL